MYKSNIQQCTDLNKDYKIILNHDDQKYLI